VQRARRRKLEGHQEPLAPPPEERPPELLLENPPPEDEKPPELDPLDQFFGIPSELDQRLDGADLEFMLFGESQ
jgi:hypothetical protein